MNLIVIENFSEAVDSAARAARVSKIKAYARKKDAQFERNMRKADKNAAHAKRGGRTMPPSSADRYDLAAMAAAKRNRAQNVASKYDASLPAYDSKLARVVSSIKLRRSNKELKGYTKRVGSVLKTRRASKS